MNRLVTGIAVTVIGGFILALLIAECKDKRRIHDAIIRLEEKSK